MTRKPTCSTCLHGPADRCDEHNLALTRGWQRNGGYMLLQGPAGAQWFKCPRYAPRTVTPPEGAD